MDDANAIAAGKPLTKQELDTALAEWGGSFRKEQSAMLAGINARVADVEQMSTHAENVHIQSVGELRLSITDLGKTIDTMSERIELFLKTTDERLAARNDQVTQIERRVNRIEGEMSSMATLLQDMDSRYQRVHRDIYGSSSGESGPPSLYGKIDDLRAMIEKDRQQASAQREKEIAKLQTLEEWWNAEIKARKKRRERVEDIIGFFTGRRVLAASGGAGAIAIIIKIAELVLGG